MSFYLCPYPNIEHSILAVAVSGGADSMGLALWLKKYCDITQKKLIALTVDHGLRVVSSTQEAIQVQAWLEEKHIETHILTWTGPKPKASIQEKAREKRYELLINFCKNNEINHLFTAHHQQDNLETFLMRLFKGSGLKGLMGILPVTQMNGITLHRPFLKVSPQRIKDYLKTVNQNYIEDPSNHNTDFKRVFIRKNLKQLKEIGFDENSLEQVLKSLSPAFIELENTTQKIIQDMTVTQFGSYELSIHWLKDHPYSFCEALQTFFKIFKTYGIKKEKINTLRQTLEVKKRATLGGFIFSIVDKKIAITREYRSCLKSMPVKKNDTVIFDHRFKLTSSAEGVLKPLGEKYAAIYRDHLKEKGLRVPNYFQCLALPAFFNEMDELVDFIYYEVPTTQRVKSFVIARTVPLEL